MKIRLESGEEADAQRFDGTSLTMLSPRPFAPGSPIRFALADDGEAAARNLEGRTIGSKRVDDALFEVKLRFVNLRREERELLKQKVDYGD